jgi:hypothetical protein
VSGGRRAAADLQRDIKLHAAGVPLPPERMTTMSASLMEPARWFAHVCELGGADLRRCSQSTGAVPPYL